MSSFTTLDTMRFVGTVLESSFYGLYCVAFAVHMRIRSTNNLKGGGTNVAIYPLCVLFVLCTLFCALDTAQTLFILRYESSLIPGVGVTSYNMNITNTVIYCLITFIAQGVLIHRCWLMYGKHILAVSIPLMLALLSFGASLAMIGGLIEPPSLRYPDAPLSKSWYYSLSSAAYSASLGVNGILAILLTIKTFIFIRQTQKAFIDQKQKVHPVRQITSLLNESGILMVGCQIIWLVLFRRSDPAFFLVRGPIVMIFGLTPTLILHRVSQPLGQLISIKEKPRAGRGAATTVRFVN